MQVVYSGGSNCAPYASPRFCRKVYGQPFMPGYSMGLANTPATQHPHVLPHHKPQQHHQHYQPQVPHPHTRHHHHHHHQDEESLRDSIPAMKRGVAIACLVCNVVMPGLGTIISGFTVCCGSRVRKTSQTIASVIRTNCLVALIQFATTFLFLLGWIWSIMWGVAFITHSAEYKADSREHCGERPTPVTERCRQSDHKKHAPPVVVDNCIIALQQPPVLVERPDDESRSQPILNCVNPRQQRILRRRMSEQEFQTAMLTTDGIEEIIVRDYPVHNFNGEVVTEHIAEESSPSKW